jgi:gamma-glutamylcyclotransferase (GGCT)/AIG2-like uncharacterized protein YtfP
MSAATPVIRVFVYGTLRPGSTNPHAVFLSFRCRSLGCARVRGRLFRHGAQFAAIYEPDGSKEITGEIFLLPADHGEQVLESLDRYEGIGVGLRGEPAFQRERVMAILTDGNCMECWTWVFALPVNGLTEIRGGDAQA